MNLKEVKAIAKGKGMKTEAMKKDELIRAIQRHEGYDPCFGDNVRAKDCDQMNCAWRKDCAQAL